MVSAKIHCAVAVVAVLFLGALLPASHASTARYIAPAPSPASYVAPAPSPAHTTPAAPRPSRIQPVFVVQGVIYCKSCKLSGYNPYMDASPLPNATAQLVCYGDKVMNMTSTPSDKNGYFMVMVYKLDAFRRSKCRVYLGSSPTPLCSAPSIPSNRWLGLTLEKERVAASSLPKGVRGVYRPKSGALMFGPGSSGKCPSA
ncbi:hypothetical protein GUJ93_ZPchr0010g10211 [Zizania palustris]|uniref:Uncharacterized protein n=1 Tax=Zizania palustris TaxID=103762 RepID=A0A8J5WD58_ZIZPA|nr:hypothetical protein GUJ93_ZPchr0010g10211 [Zizania palustris]